ncbi:hypothetical protein AX16_003132 [Volvariella volvacea WC 439]|nr:hypothetical protein AX16_003132 [Volvariella volvacea WC 439]
MSRFTAPAFHRSPFQFPRAPLSPPDTNNESVGPAQVPPSLSVVGGGVDPRHVETDTQSGLPITLETHTSKLRRGPSIAYHSTGLRESREKTVQRSPRTFVIVIPPARFTQERGQLGHTLAIGPAHRLSQGILMPLFPTMYAQLTAIAREFNFPSTTGLCLYFHFTENGVTMTPRISDEHWQHVWAYALDSSTPHRPPISGKIEFDIDFRLARWYGTWLSSSHREQLDVPISANQSPAPSIAHFRGDSRTTLAEVLAGDDQSEPRLPAPVSRHAPRKLSLVDRFDFMSARSISRPVSRGHSPPEHPSMPQAVLSPIFQEEEPKTAKHDLEDRVKSWRASSMVNPSALAINGQTSLEPANLPNNLPLDDGILTADQPLRLEDFAWSVSSVGPDDYDSMSVLSYERLPSPDIARRMYDDCPPTPSTMTTWGPPSYPPSDVDYEFEPALSIDLGHRGVFSRPITPDTITSWGAPSFSQPPSPISERFCPSVHLEYRFDFSRPVTPATATSWGPVSVTWPSSPDSRNSEFSIHLASRGIHSLPVTPSTAASWEHFNAFIPGVTTSVSDHSHEHAEMQSEEEVPFIAQQTSAGVESAPSTNASSWDSSSYPHLIIYPPVYPYFDLYPTTISGCEPADYPHLVIDPPTGGNLDEIAEPVVWKHVWPYSTPSNSSPQPWKQVWPYTSRRAAPVDTKIQPAYPYIVIYPAVYPHFDLYAPGSGSGTRSSVDSPAVSSDEEQQRAQCAELPVCLSVRYPSLVIYPTVYPWSLAQIYPSSSVHETSFIKAYKPSAGIAPQYPIFDIYPAAYSAMHATDLQQQESILVDAPAVYSLSGSDAISTDTNAVTTDRKQPGLNEGFTSMISSTTNSAEPCASTGYPNIVVYEPIAPQVNLIPTAYSRGITYPSFSIYPAIYPHFDLYPTVFPANASPAYQQGASITSPLQTVPGRIRSQCIEQSLSAVKYPFFNIYPAVYPYFDLYPNVEQVTATPVTDTPKATNTGLNYPIIVPYPAVFPHFDLYPAISCEVSSTISRTMSSIPPTTTISLSNRYPVFDLYPAVYPLFNLYPTIFRDVNIHTTDNASMSSAAGTSSDVFYPIFNLYPAVYPHFDIYPPKLDKLTQPIQLTAAMDQSGKPALLFREQKALRPRVKPPGRLTHSELHAMVMMELAQSSGVFGLGEGSQALGERPRKTHRDLHNEVFLLSPRPTPTGGFLDQEEVSSPRVYRGTTNPYRPVSASLAPRRPPPQLPLPATPSPRRRLPSSPLSSSIRLSAAYEDMSALMIESGLSPERGPAPRRLPIGNYEITRQAAPNTESRSPITGSPTAGSGATSSLTRTGSLALPRNPRPAVDPERKLNRSLSSSNPRPLPKKRESLVLQRIKELDNAANNGAEPPRKVSLPLRLGVTPRALDRSRYPFAS